jgi:hypothetical protein
MSQNIYQEHIHRRSFSPMSKRRITSRFAIVGNVETPIKDAIKISLITLAAVSLTILSLSVFVEISK